MLMLIDATEIRRYFASRPDLSGSDAKEFHQRMEKQKGQLLDLLYRKARALAYQESLVGQQTEAFDGTSFTEVADLSKGIYEQGYAPLGASPQSNQAAISAGGKDANPGTLNITEEWEAPLANKTITSS